MKFKLILIYPENKLKLQRFLNEQSSRGWHLIKQRIFGLQMTYDPEVQYHYEVILSNEIRTASNGPQDQQ